MVMKARNCKYFLKEAFSSIWINKWMGIASTIVVLVLLLMFGTLFLFAINFNNSLGDLIKNQAMEAFFLEDANQNTMDSVIAKIKNINGVEKTQFFTKEQGFDEFKNKLGNHKDILVGYSPKDIATAKVKITLNKPELSQSIKTTIESMKEIKKVNYVDKAIIDKALKVRAIIRALLFIAVSILGVVALFIIIYTIKLTVFSRRREINIMKYVGATDWFVRWPFVIEGIIIGLVGAILAAIIIQLGYNYIYTVFDEVGANTFKLIQLDAGIKRNMFIIFTLVGSGIGAIGSLISVRKYLDV